MNYCTFCGQNHPVALCPHTYGGSAARGNMRCTYCGKATHTAEYCPDTFAGEGNRRRNPNGTFLD